MNPNEVGHTQATQNQHLADAGGEIQVPWSENPEENRSNINLAIAEAKRTGQLLRWDTRPYRLNAMAQPAASEARSSGDSTDSAAQTKEH